MRAITTAATYFIVIDLCIRTNALSGTTQNKAMPYVVARGDGSQGGGGLPMPQSSDDADTLKRPKVGAEMPQGRPSWFRVPAPSSGTVLYHQKFIVTL